MNIVLLGAPASGKGTQAQMLAKRFTLFHLQTGDIARKLAEKDKRIKDLIDSGKLIPAEEMTMHVLDFLLEKKRELTDILFEGFPRYISQYKALANFLESKGDDIDAVFSLDVSEKVAIERISSRRICNKCTRTYNIVTNPPQKEGECDVCDGDLVLRADDNPESVKVRFQYYQDNTKELIDHLDSLGKLIRVDGERAIEDIHADLSVKLEKIIDSKK